MWELSSPHVQVDRGSLVLSSSFDASRINDKTVQKSHAELRNRRSAMSGALSDRCLGFWASGGRDGE
jgi:hypothetical protein